METTIDNLKKNNNGRTMAGVIILVIGGLLLIDQLDLFFIPGWLFSWPMWIIGYGLYMGAKYDFKKPVWIFMILMGGAFLLTDNINNAGDFVWPIGIIAVGAWMVVKHNKQAHPANQDHHYTQV